MLEYLIVLFFILLGTTLLPILGLSPLWILLPVLIFSIPTVYTMLQSAPYVPTDMPTVKKMMKLADIQPGEIVVDLGCGDGRAVREATRMGATGIGYELSTYLYLVCIWYGEGIYYWKNFWKIDYSQVDVVFYYHMPRNMKRFTEEIWPQLKPGCRVIMNTFSNPYLQASRVDGHTYRYDKE